MAGPSAQTGGGTMIPTPDVWAAHYLNCSDAMHAAARSVLWKHGRLDLVDDAIQNAIQSLIANPPAGIENLEALMVATAKRRAIDLARAKAVKDRADLADEDCPTQTTEDVVFRRMHFATVRKALASLPHDERYVLQEVIMWGRKAVEVAAELNLSPSRISKLKANGLNLLRDRLRKEAA
jgi:RNA polymerase sigma factor (sigma-70 family)